MLDIAILIVTGTVNLLLGMLVFLRNPKAKTSRSFLLISVFVTLWVVCNYLASNASLALSVNRLCNSLAFLFAYLAIAFGLRFCVNFLEPTYLGFGKFWDKGFAYLGVLTAIWSVCPQVAGHVTKPNGVLHFSVGTLLPFYILSVVLFLVLIIRTLLMIIAKRRGREKQQAIFILIGFSVPTLLALITNAIIPSLTSSWHSASLGPIFTILLVGTITYAIVRHRLFDIRFAVALSFAYLLSALTVVGLYSLITFGVARYLLGLKVSAANTVLFALLSAFTALSFGSLKGFFNKISNRIFYRDAYDAQSVLNQVSNILVGTVDIAIIRQQLQAVLDTSLHPSKVEFLLADEVSKENRKLFAELMHQPSGIILVDDIDMSAHMRAHEHLRERDYAMAVKLRTRHEDLGFLLLGYRKSGSMYTEADLRLLQLIADELALGIQNALRFREIENFNATLQEKIDDATKRLRQSNAKLRTLDETKDDFISMASHQLRTPLTSVKGYVSMVLDGDAGKISPLQRKLLTQSFVSSQRMVYLISDLLNLSRLRTGKFIIEEAPCNLADIVKGEIEQLVETAKSRNLELIYNKPDHFPTYLMDETKLRQVIMNFVDNAIYYTPAGGKIEVNLVERPESIELTVVDNGIGVPKTEQHHLFSKFYRANNAKRARPDGTGLGLFMAKKVVIAQGGAIIFKSQEGKGSTFGFTFAKNKLKSPPQA